MTTHIQPWTCPKCGHVNEIIGEFSAAGFCQSNTCCGDRPEPELPPGPVVAAPQEPATNVVWGPETLTTVEDGRRVERLCRVTIAPDGVQAWRHNASGWKRITGDAAVLVLSVALRDAHRRLAA